MWSSFYCLCKCRWTVHYVLIKGGLLFSIDNCVFMTDFRWPMRCLVIHRYGNWRKVTSFSCRDVASSFVMSRIDLPPPTRGWSLLAYSSTYPTDTPRRCLHQGQRSDKIPFLLMKLFYIYNTCLSEICTHTAKEESRRSDWPSATSKETSSSHPRGHTPCCHRNDLWWWPWSAKTADWGSG